MINMIKSVLLKVFKKMSSLGILNWLSDKRFISIFWNLSFNRRINFDDPKTFNEKLQWLKLNDRKEEYTDMVDKYVVKEYISKKIGNKYVIPSLFVFNNPEEIDFEKLPNQFVIKCNHGSHCNIICKNKENLDLKKTKKDLKKWMKKNWYYYGREWPYKNIKKKIIIEKYMEDKMSGDVLNDYKIMCFNGVPKLIEIHRNRGKNGHTQDFYDTNWKKTTISNVGIKNYNGVISRPHNLEEMLKLSKILSKGMSHVRIDWYEINKKLYFSEITFYDGSGFVPYDNYDDDLKLGNWIKLPEKVGDSNEN